MTETETIRQAVQMQQFPNGIPSIWCPTLTHFRVAREPDAQRIRSHLASLSPVVHGILVPGSTGEGWEMNDADILALLTIVLDAAEESGVHVLVGVLKTNIDDVLACLDSMEHIREHPAVAGFTICPPKGSDLTQQAIRDGLSVVLERGWPTALYQLPQVTQNEMSAETVAGLASEFPNFILFKDSSGLDQVAQSGLNFGGVFMLRGAEQGGYAAWLRQAGGPYDGFLLSTANAFASELAEMLFQLDEGNIAAARVISEKLVDVVSRAFAIVREFPFGNAFANANKILDHCLAYGDDALHIDPPMLYSGVKLPKRFIESAHAMLREHSFLPRSGYYHQR